MSSRRKDLVVEIVKTDTTFKETYTTFDPRFDDFAFKRRQTGWKGKCLHCNATLFVNSDGVTDATIEHIVPQSADGSDDLMNLALACKNCNNEKGIRHDPYYPGDQRASEVIASLLAKRASRFTSE